MGLNKTHHKKVVSAVHVAYTCTDMTQLWQATELQRMHLCMRAQQLQKMYFASERQLSCFHQLHSHIDKQIELFASA